jgi:Chalcone isomerase N-terminal domain
VSAVTNVRSIVMHDIPLEDIAAMERWYHRYHAPEIVRRYGPWLARHESYIPAVAPPESQSFAVFNWRMTDGWWRSLPLPGAQGALAFTDPPFQPRVATCFIPWQPDHDWLGADVWPDDRQVLRWFVMLKYPAGVTREQGDAWFINEHAPQVLQQRGLTRFFSYSTVQAGVHLPGTWKPGSAPAPGMVERGWDRVVELWYENFRDWRRAVIQAPPLYTAPAWATHDTYPFLQPGQDFVSCFLLERPNDEFLRDSRIALP